MIFAFKYIIVLQHLDREVSLKAWQCGITRVFIKRSFG